MEVPNQPRRVGTEWRDWPPPSQPAGTAKRRAPQGGCGVPSSRREEIRGSAFLGRVGKHLRDVAQQRRAALFPGLVGVAVEYLPDHPTDHSRFRWLHQIQSLPLPGMSPRSIGIPSHRSGAGRIHFLISDRGRVVRAWTVRPCRVGRVAAAMIRYPSGMEAGSPALWQRSGSGAALDEVRLRLRPGRWQVRRRLLSRSCSLLVTRDWS